ncbi:MAG: hypothetical protein J6C09_05595 [Clostridia bacterium]|nr:hypothetical protein [Clostridia bacterium]
MGTRIIAMILAILCLFYVLPTAVLAEAAGELASDSESQGEEAAAAPGLYESPTYEVEELREKDVKHFRLEDGSYVAAQYSSAVHYENEDGELVDIDNELNADGSSYANKNSRIKFAKKTGGGGELFTLKDGNTKITLSLIGAKKGVEGFVMNNSDSEEMTELQKMLNLESLSSSITYSCILDGVDLQYVVHSLDVKENIIVNERQDSYSYSFELKLNGLSAELDGEGNVRLFNGEGTRFTIPAPVVHDAAYELCPSDMAYYTLEGGGNGKYTLTVSADSEWMNSEDRAFPVTIDPAIMTAQTTNTEIACIYNGSLTVPTVSSTSTKFIYKHGGIYLIRLTELPAIASGAYVGKALFNVNYHSSAGKVFPPLNLQKVLAPWSGISRSDPYSGGISTEVIDYSLGYDNYLYSWDITELAAEWYNNVNCNNGVAISLNVPIAQSDPVMAGYGLGNVTALLSVGEMVTNPVLSVQYNQSVGLEDYWSYSSHSIGTAGSGSVKLNDGALTIAIPTLSTTDSLVPYTPTLVYNSVYSGGAFAYPNASTAYSGSYMPYGFKLNISETVVQKRYYKNGVLKDYYVLCDADGTEHVFYPTTSNSNVCKDSDGLQLTMTIGTDAVIMETKEQSKLTFLKMPSNPSTDVYGAWYLGEITDKNGNSVVFTYDSAYRPTAVSIRPSGQSAILMLNLYYYSTGKLRMVYNSASKDAVVFRYSSTYNGSLSTSTTNYLRQIDYAHGNSSVTLANWESFAQSATSLTNITLDASALYSYSSDGKLISCEDSLAGQKMNYSWSGSRVSGISQYAGTALGQQMSFSYGAGFAEVRATGNDEILNTSDDILTRYAFDDKGRTASTYSCAADGTEIYGGVSGEYETEESAKNNIKHKATFGGSAVNYILNGSFEDGANHWSTSGSVSTTWSTTFGGEGNQCAEFTPRGGSVATLSQLVRLNEGKYTLSMPYRALSCEGVTGTVTVSSTVGSGFSHTAEISTSVNISTGTLSYFSTSFSLSATDTLKIEIRFATTAGTANYPAIQIDRVMLENNVAHSQYSLVDYGSFEESSLNSAGTATAISEYWTTESGTAPTVVVDESPFGSVLKLTKNSGTRYAKHRAYEISADEIYKYDNQRYEFISNAGQDYLLSGFGKAIGAIQSASKIFGIRADVIYYQGTGKDDVVKSYSFKFSAACEGWQFVGGYFTTEYLPETGDTNDYSCVKAIDVYCEYTGQANNYALFDNISLVNCEGKFVEKYAYYNDEAGTSAGLLAEKQTYGYTEYYEYNSDKQISRTANNEGKLYDYYYNAKGNVSYTVEYNFTYNGFKNYPLNTVDPDALIVKVPQTRTDYSYNSYGQCTYTETYPLNASGERISGENSISHSYYYQMQAGSRYFGALLSETDSMSVTTGYYYDELDGSLLARFNKTACKGVCYSYDAMGRLVGVRPAAYSSTNGYAPVDGAENIGYTYNSQNLLSAITTESTVYNITYDVFGNTAGIEAGDNTLAEYTYGDNNGKLEKITYGNGFAVEYFYDTIENLSEIWYTKSGTRSKAYSYEYTADGLVYKLVDHINGKTRVYRYGVGNKLLGVVDYDNSDLVHDFSIALTYDEKDRLYVENQHLNYTHGGNVVSDDVQYLYTYTDDGKLSKMEINASAMSSMIYSYDSFDRLTRKRLYLGMSDFTTQYTYREKTNLTNTEISRYTFSLDGDARTYDYSYDSNGNITRVVDSIDGECRYYYDNLGQLVREDNAKKNETYVYTYDNAGNITSKKTYTYTTSVISSATLKSTYNYGYSSSDWGDLLTSYRGTTITYDGIGNPTSYYNGTSYYFTWSGRELASATKGGKTYSFGYNDEGIRTSKTVNGVTTTYYLSGSQIIAEQNPNYTIIYLYEQDGSPFGFQYLSSSYSSATAWDSYIYEKNMQGDIVGIYDLWGGKLASYTYDAWGNFTVTYHNGGGSTSVTKNPLTYRGYYYDQDLGLYYLNARYYDSVTHRFVSADGAEYLGANGDINSYNLFAYCSNNPVNCVDPSGHFVITLSSFLIGIAIGAGVGASISVGTTVCLDFLDDGKIFNGSIGADEYLGNAVGAMLSGVGVGACGVLGAGLGAAMIAGETLAIGGMVISGVTAFGIGAGVAFITGGAGYTVRTAINSKEIFQISDMFIEAGSNTASGIISFVGGMAGGVTGVHVPGEKNGISGFLKYHGGLTYFGAYPTKILISQIKNNLQGAY